MDFQSTMCALFLLIGFLIVDVLGQDMPAPYITMCTAALHCKNRKHRQDVQSVMYCDKVFSSYGSGSRKGEFQSPGYPSHYPNGVSCKFKFIGQKGVQRVKIKFTDFNLQGRQPSCTNDYINIYSQLKTESADLLGAPMTGPFCGEGTENLPALLLSTKHILVIYFYSNKEKSNNGFRGTYEFVEFDHDMPTASPDHCGYMMKSYDKLNGNIKSPTYPGVYQDNIFCSYSLEGEPGQRIKLTFQDFSLFYGGEYCPFDYLTIYDGKSKYDAQIGKFCGSYNRSTVIYSTTEYLWLEFTTGEDRLDFDAHSYQTNADFQFERRGFNISYEFSDEFVQLDHTFVMSGTEHIRGTECDLRIMSGKETSGTFVSPSYPGNFPKDVVCSYYLDGLMDEQNLEKVQVRYEIFNIPGNMPFCILGYLDDDSDYVKKRYCGNNGNPAPPQTTSKGPRMVVTLNTTGSMNGGRFKANYKFITDYDIPGQQIEEGKCRFHYTSKQPKGTINSPRHPGIYPLNTNCEYIFRPQNDMMVVISFTVFVLSDQDNVPCDTGDYVAFYENIGHRKSRENYTLTEKYCGKTFPGPYATSRLLKMIFHSDDLNGFVGFKANYQFVKRSVLDNKGEYSVGIDARGTGGVIISPNYPSKYPSLKYCEWTVTASSIQNRILAEITEFNMEGQYGRKGAKSSCENVAIRIYNDSMRMKPVDVICGRKKEIDINSYMSNYDSFKVTFVTSSSSLGGKGFKISWTEIHTGASNVDCSGFQCAKNKFCIAPSLKCNKEPNCGEGDNSDETTKCPSSSAVPILHISIGTSISSFFCIILLICGFYHRRKMRTERFPPDHDHVEVRYVSAPTGCNTTDRLLMDDRNDGSGNNMANENHNNTSTTQSPRCQKVSMV